MTFTINSLCAEEKISRAHYYNLQRRGEGPREMRVGATIRITDEARADWHREREAAWQRKREAGQ